MMAKKRSDEESSLIADFLASLVQSPSSRATAWVFVRTKRGKPVCSGRCFFSPATSPWSEKLGAANQRRAFHLARLCFRAVRPDDSAAAAVRCRIIALVCFLFQMQGSQREESSGKQRWINYNQANRGLISQHSCLAACLGSMWLIRLDCIHVLLLLAHSPLKRWHLPCTGIPAAE